MEKSYTNIKIVLLGLSEKYLIAPHEKGMKYEQTSTSIPFDDRSAE